MDWGVRATAVIVDIQSREIASFLTDLAAVFCVLYAAAPWQNPRENCRRCHRLSPVLSGADKQHQVAGGTVELSSWLGTSI